ncbi:MAG: hypothetical protein JXM71_02660 [Spirochaetales bacterium]|nr:hypothetical protein [Spirochaetales bacterium]
MDYNRITSFGLEEAWPVRADIPSAAAADAALDGVRSLVGYLAEKTTCITMLAGSGSRWVASLAAAKAAGRESGADEKAPRGLFPVYNALGFGPDPLPIAGYALAAVRDLGHHLIVVRGWERRIQAEILEPLDYAPGSWSFATQDAPGGKPRGHGDAAFQTMALWSSSKYVVINFGGDASSPLSALDSLAVMDALAREHGDGAPGLIMPSALVRSPSYPVSVGPDGLPTAFGHAKLSGSASVSNAEYGYTNVGVRVYRAAALREAILSIRERYWSEAGGYAIPGNAPADGDPAGGEFALDNVDALMAEQGRARLLPVARAEELSPVKSLDDVPRFERDVRVVCADWALAYSNSGLGLEKK